MRGSPGTENLRLAALERLDTALKSFLVLSTQPTARQENPVAKIYLNIELNIEADSPTDLADALAGLATAYTTEPAEQPEAEEDVKL